MVAQGEIWWATADKRRPVLVITRSQAIPVLHEIVVAPVTRTVRGIPTEIPLGPTEGLPDDCAATVDNLQLLPKTWLTERVGYLDYSREAICRALEALADC